MFKYRIHLEDGSDAGDVRPSTSPAYWCNGEVAIRGASGRLLRLDVKVRGALA